MPVIPEYELLTDVTSYFIIIRAHDEDVDEANFTQLKFIASFFLVDSLNFDIFLDFINNTFDIIYYKFSYPNEEELVLEISVCE